MQNAILRWNDVLLDTALNDCQRPPAERDQDGPTRVSRAAAMVHVAIHDALNGVDKKNEPLRPHGAPVGLTRADADDAINGAAYTILIELFPRQLSILTSRLPALGSPGGFAYGVQVGVDILAWRTNDGAVLPPPPPYVASPPGDGVWQPDPDLAPPGPPLTPHWGTVKPFALTSSVNSLAPAGPPAELSEPDHSQPVDEVFVLGWENEAVPAGAPAGAVARTPDQSVAAFFWAYDDELGTVVRLYNQNARQVLEQETNVPAGSELHRHARYFAHLNVAMADAAIVCWHTKFRDNLWRPYQGLQTAQNQPVQPPFLPGRKWLPLGRPHARSPEGNVPRATPNFPAYTSGHAAFGGALFGTMRKFFGKDFDITLSSEMTPSPRSFTGTDPWKKAAAENSLSRLWLGVHWSPDATEGQTTGQKVADDLWDNQILWPVPP